MRRWHRTGCQGPCRVLLEQVGSDVASADRKLHQLLQLKQQIRELQVQVRSTLSGIGCQDLNELEARRMEAADRRQSLRQQLDELKANSPVVESLTDAPPAELERRITLLSRAAIPFGAGNTRYSAQFGDNQTDKIGETGNIGGAGGIQFGSRLSRSLPPWKPRSLR